MPDTIEHLDDYPPAIQTQFRWMLSRLDTHDAEFKGVETRFEATERRAVELANADAQSRADRSQIQYRVEQLEGTLRKLQEAQEKDALPLIKEIHDTTRLAQDQGADLKEHGVAIAKLLDAVQTLTVSQTEQQQDQKRLRKALKRIEEAQRHQMSRLLKWSGGILGIAVSLTVIFTYFAQHLAFH